MKTVFFILFGFVSYILPVSNACKGCLTLDEYNFNKIISRFKVVLVKFDIAYPYGDKHDTFAKLADEVVQNKNLILTEVGVKDYGDKDNEKLAAKYGIKGKDDLPSLRLFIDNNANDPIIFPKSTEWTLDNIRNFVRDNSEIYIGLPGCLEDFDKIAAEFMRSDNKNEQYATAEKKIKLLDEGEQDVGNTYMKFMKKIIDNGTSFVSQEFKRLEKIIKEGKINEKKKQNLSYKLNILRAFTLPSKTEL